VAQQAAVEQEIVKMYEGWAAAIREGDTGWFRRTLVEEIYGRGTTMRFTAVWQKQDGRWRALAHQATEE
jgi:ketosteroid isomerase-like protein